MFCKEDFESYNTIQLSKIYMKKKLIFILAVMQRNL